MNRARNLLVHALPVHAPLTREGEVQLARQFEQGEILIMEGMLLSGIDARTVLLGPLPHPRNPYSKDAPLSRELTPHRFEVVNGYVKLIELAERGGISKKERRATLRRLVPHRTLTRRLLTAMRTSVHTRGTAHRIDPRIRLGLARSEAAREELLRANLGIITRIARKYLGRGLGLQDLLQEGHIGLLRAIEMFDYRLGHRFVTYASWWIRSVITRALEITSREIRIPSHIITMQRRASNARDRLAEISGNYPADAELARYLDISEENLELLSNVVKQPLSLELPRDKDGGGTDRTLGSIVADTESLPPDDIVESGETAALVRRKLGILRPREKEIISLRFGIGNGRDHTLQELGDRFGLSRERVRQIELAALKKLRRAYEKEADDLHDASV